MGNCFGKESSSSDAFAQPGRTLGGSSSNAPPANTRASIPPRIAAQSPGRTLGATSSPAIAPASNDPKAAAARAAEERAMAAQGKGKLGKQLDARKAMTNSAALAQVSRETRAARDADAAAEARNWN
ncbi:hypothetical protein LTR66_010352 [Elasticomyces elasticus]|nr:hypothetical protein LTR28_001626 [Elasticomyces elasticus]KAK4980799.1 hypothetical protein LTR66_010352 [Elasticomyces elasticus]KAK4987151.1 hypothetical protein LTR50_004848 [Elasticomyces elasticus]